MLFAIFAPNTLNNPIVCPYFFLDMVSKSNLQRLYLYLMKVKGCVRYILASLFYMSKREHF